MYLQTCGCFKSAKKLGSANCKSTSDKSVNHKKIFGLQIAHLQNAAFAGGPQILLYKLSESTKLVALWFADLFADITPLLFIKCEAEGTGTMSCDSFCVY
jgi:hypothetical protein